MTKASSNRTDRRAAARRATRLAVTGAAVVAMTALAAGCGGSSGNNAAPPSDPVDTVATVPEPSTTTTTVPPEGFAPVARWEWTMATADGYRLKGDLALGAVTKAADAPPLGTVQDPAEDLSCVDPDTDALIPASLSLTNDTAGFSWTLSNNFYLASTETSGALIQSAPEGQLSVAALYSGGPDCHAIVTADDAFFSHGEGWGLKWDDPTAPGATAGTHNAYLILPDYYTPANPSGDVDRLDQVGLSLVDAMRTDHASLVSLTGPNSQTAQQGGAFLFSALRPAS